MEVVDLELVSRVLLHSGVAPVSLTLADVVSRAIFRELRRPRFKIFILTSGVSGTDA